MTILIIGVSTRAMAESALHGGYPVVALDAFGDLDLQARVKSYSLKRDFQRAFSAAALLTASRQLTYDMVAYTSNLENHPEVIRRFARQHQVLGNPAEVLTRVRHWPSFFAALAQAGFRVPETIYQAAAPDAAMAARRWLCKPAASGGGHGVTFWRGAGALVRGFMLQEYVPGLACSASFVANGRECVVVGLTEQLVGRAEFGAQGFSYCGNLLPLDAARDPVLGPAVLDQVRQIAALVTREFGLVGVNGMDFVLSGDRVCVTEINPRYSASMELIERAYHLPVFELHLRAALQGDLPAFDLAARLEARPFHGKAILYAERDVVAANSPPWLGRGIRDVPAPGERLAQGSPICTLLASEPTRDQCFANLVTQAETLKGELYAG